MIAGGGGWLEGDKPRVAAVRTEGVRGWVTLTSDGWRADVPFTRASGAWKLEGFFGLGLEHLERIERHAPQRPFPEPERPVNVSTERGKSCRATSDADYPRIAGGCEMRVTDKSVRVEMLTPFGGFAFGECSIDYRLRIGGQGRTWTSDWAIEGTADSGCSDVEPCVVQRGQVVHFLPWKGRVSGDGDGGFVHRADMCLRTCIGMFAGEYVLELTPADTPSGWRVGPDDAGNTGFRLNDSMDATGDSLTISATRSPGAAG